jgi:hypothetical protein
MAFWLRTFEANAQALSLSAHLLASTTRFTMPVRHGSSFGPMHAPALIFVALPCTLNCRVRCIWHNVVCLFRAFFRHDAQQWPDGKMDAMCCWLSLSLGWLLLHATAIPFVLLDAILSGPHTLSSICPFPYTMDAGCLLLGRLQNMPCRRTPLLPGSLFCAHDQHMFISHLRISCGRRGTAPPDA